MKLKKYEVDYGETEWSIEAHEYEVDFSKGYLHFFKYGKQIGIDREKILVDMFKNWDHFCLIEEEETK